MSWDCEDCGRKDIAGDGNAMPAILHRLREQLTAEATPLPGSTLRYGRPHAHPRTRYFPRFSKTGERIAGVVKVRPDCPRPIRGRCECPSDGSWRPSVGVVRADSTVRTARVARLERMPDGLAPAVWVDDIYEHGPDGLWRCRWPVRRSLERLRGSSVRAWSIAIRLLRGDAIATVWGSHGAPPDPTREAVRLLAQLERWAKEERETEWERRPRQWWDAPRDPNARSVRKSEAQANAERATRVQGLDSELQGAATLPPTGRAQPSSPVRRIGRGQVEQPSSTTGAHQLSGIAIPHPGEERACA